MEFLFTLIPVTVRSYLEYLFYYVLTPSAVWIIIAIVAYKYWQTARIRRALYGASAGFLRDFLLTLAFGVAGGFLGSFLMVFFGITLTDEMMYLLPIALLLMLVNARYLCFSYSGGLISILSFLLGWPSVNIPQIMGLVAILHMVEAILIRFSGHIGAVPVYAKNRQGITVGAFNLISFWPVPILILVFASVPLDQVSITPDWWPFIKPNIPEDANAALAPFMLIALLGYGDLAVTTDPLTKSRESSKYLGIYSFVLLVLAVLGSSVPVLAILPALFGPLAHEALILWQQKRELEGVPRYIHPQQGVLALEIFAHSLAWAAGMRRGDTLLSVNGMVLYHPSHILWINESCYGPLELEYIDARRGQILRESVYKNRGEALGILPAPQPNDPPMVTFRQGNWLKHWLDSLKLKH